MACAAIRPFSLVWSLPGLQGRGGRGGNKVGRGWGRYIRLRCRIKEEESERMRRGGERRGREGGKWACLDPERGVSVLIKGKDLCSLE